MTPKCSNVLAALESAPLFSKVGMPMQNEDWRPARSWLDAMAHCVGSNWTNTLIEASNILRENILARSKDRYLEWAGLDRECRPAVLDFAQRKTADLMRMHGLPDKFMHSVFASVLGIIHEADYSDLVAPGFYTNIILDCYLKGHFPCGWDGEFYAGRLIAY